MIAKGQIRYGDVRRLQRDYLPGGITNHEELELLISLNAKLVRADKAWAQWLVAAVAEFVANGEAGGILLKKLPPNGSGVSFPPRPRAWAAGSPDRFGAS